MYKRVDQKNLKYFGHAERTEERRELKGIYRAEVDEVRSWLRPKRRWRDGIDELEE